MKRIVVTGAALVLGTIIPSPNAPARAAVGVAVTASSAAPTGCEDYFNPPWGYPPDYCNYEIWDQPVYADRVWYNGPIYWRWDNGVRVFWIRGRWQRHAWVGPLPQRWAWGRKGYVNWHGKSVNGTHIWLFGSRHNWRGHAHGHAQGAQNHDGRGNQQPGRRHRARGRNH